MRFENRLFFSKKGPPTVMPRMSFVLSFIFAGCSALWLGCGPKVDPEYPVSGTVTLDGSPMPQGQVTFRDDVKAVFSTFTVTNGQFNDKSEAGNFKVEINSFRDETAQPGAGGYVPPGGTTKINIVLPEYNATSKITAEVKSSGPNEFKFEAKTK
jgi:hypothetical protein